MSALVRIGDSYYFGLWVPKDVRRFFPRPEFVKSTHARKYQQAKGLTRGLLGKAEELFMVIRSKWSQSSNRRDNYYRIQTDIDVQAEWCFEGSD